MDFLNQNLLYLIPAIAVFGLIIMAIQTAWIKKQSTGNERMSEIAKYIHNGALAFLNAEYRLLAVFVVISGALLGYISTIVESTHWFIVVAFVIGAVFSAVAGNIGMRIATEANVRTTEAARTSLSKGLKVSFSGGTVMGLGVAGLAVFGLSMLFILLIKTQVLGDIDVTNVDDMIVVLEALAGFSLGAESIALFARVGGGIYTKAADVGADLVGKVEAGIPEDDPRNPATIADNVGDNVGDVAGMGADLFGSYVATVLAAMVLGVYVVRDMGDSYQDKFGGLATVLLPLVISALGIIFSIIGSKMISVKDGGKESDVQSALNKGNWGSIILTAIACYFLIKWMLPEDLTMKFFEDKAKSGAKFSSMNVFYAVLVGLGVGGGISWLTEYYTGLGKKPVLDIVRNSSTGAGTNIISGLAVGMMSTFAPIILFAAAIYFSYDFAGFYGVAIAACAMMATTAMQLAIDAFGPIADNAGGIAEMCELPEEVRERTDILDSVGNTTAAIGKGFAIASAALTALALFAAYVTMTGIHGINIFKADVLATLFVGAMVPVVFSALAMNSVGKAAMEMVKEVRRQFKEIPGIMEGKGTPEYSKCVDISTRAALKEMMLPGAITIISPILIGFTMGAEPLGSYMAGVAVSGVLWAIFQNNAGGAWDNAKKSFEAGVEIDGEMTYKGSDAHKAAVTGDTVGDPFKDTSGPSMNILIKLTCLIGLVIAPILNDSHGSTNATADEIVYKAGSGNAVSIDIPDGMYSLTKVEPNIVWTAKKISGSGHSGTISAVNGKFKVEDSKIVGGGLSLDMNTFTCTDLEGEDKQNFNEHLKSDAFLEVEKYPTAEIKILGIQAKEDEQFAKIRLQLHGGVVEYISPVSIKDFELEDGTQAFSISGEFFIDRTKHNIIYGSGSFFENLGDKAINDEVLIKFTFTAV